jgi:WD40 repeat protein
LTSPDGRYALRPGAATLTLEDVPASRKLLVLQTGGGYLCLTPDGRYVLAAGCPPQLRELATGEPVRTFEGHAREVSAVCLSSDGRLALSGSADSTV